MFDAFRKERVLSDDLVHHLNASLLIPERVLIFDPGQIATRSDNTTERASTTRNYGRSERIPHAFLLSALQQALERVRANMVPDRPRM